MKSDSGIRVSNDVFLKKILNPEVSLRELKSDLLDDSSYLNAKDSYGNTVVHYAALSGDPEKLKLCSGQEVTIQYVGANSRRIREPFQIHNNFGGMEACNNEGQGIIQFLVKQNASLGAIMTAQEAGANFNMVDHSGNGALHDAVQSNRVDLVGFLCHHMSNPNHPNKYGITPLHVASYFRDEGVVRFLCDSGVDVNVVENRGLTAADYVTCRDIDYLGPRRCSGDTTENKLLDLLAGKGVAVSNVKTKEASSEFGAILERDEDTNQRMPAILKDDGVKSHIFPQVGKNKERKVSGTVSRPQSSQKITLPPIERF